MTTLTLPATDRSPALAGTGPLLRAFLRRDRRRLLIWVLALGLLTVYTVIGLRQVYPTQADRDARATLIQIPAGTLFTGPGYGTERYTLGAMIANELSFSFMIALAIMSLLLVVRHTRADEEDGAAELLRAGAVAPHAPLTAALAVTGLANVAVALLAFGGLAGAGLALPDALSLVLGWALTGCAFGAVAAVTAQVFGQARGASGAALALLGLAAVVRGVGDVRQRHGSLLSWFSPLAWPQQTRAFVDLRWWPLLLQAVLTAALVTAAFWLTGRRDFSAGLLADHGGRGAATGLLQGPVTLFARLQRGAVLGWAAGLIVLGAAYGSLTKSVLDLVAQNHTLALVFGRGGTALSDAFVAYTSRFLALFVAAFAVGSVLRVRAEESAGRMDSLLATALDRRRLLASGAGVSAAASALLLLFAGLAGGVATTASVGEPDAVGRHVGATLVHLPAVLVVIGVTAFLVGVAPRLSALAWLVVIWALLSGMFGGLLRLPRWALDLSPFAWVTPAPAGSVNGVPLVVLTLIAAALVGLGLLGFRRRDIPA